MAPAVAGRIWGQATGGLSAARAPLWAGRGEGLSRSQGQGEEEELWEQRHRPGCMPPGILGGSERRCSESSKALDQDFW